MAIQQEDLIRLIVINAEVNVRCVMVCETPEQVAERINVPVKFVNACKNNYETRKTNE